MKKFFASIALALLVMGCAKTYDDSVLKAQIDGILTRLDALEVNVAGIQTTLGEGKFVQKVEKFVDPATGRTTGVTVTYTTGEVVHFSIEPVDPDAGPVLSVMKNGAGELCWAIDGIILQKDGVDVTVYQKPSFSIGEDGHLYVTVGNDTIDLGLVKGPKGDDGTVPVQDGIIKGLEVTDEAVIITYDNGTVAIPLATAFELIIGQTDYLVTSTDPIEVAYSVKNRTEKTVVDVYHGNDFRAEVLADKIVVTPKTADAEGQMLVYADSKSGLTSIVKLNFEGETFEITDAAADPDNHIDYLVEAEGGALAVNAVSNLAFEVKPEVDWIRFVKTRSQSFVIELSVDENPKAEIRTGTVKIVKAGTETAVQTITVAQKASAVDDGIANLGKRGTANCYIVVKAGEYKFKTVKGNSTEPVGPVAKAVVVWETDNTTTAPEAGSIVAGVAFEDDFIHFNTPATLKPGNALIAAVDASGEILWSWHIWIPKTEITTADAGFAGTFALMDRNLGALEASPTTAKSLESEGLFYQWGRKDPLMGKKIAAVPAEAVGQYVSEATDMATAIKTPTVYYYNEGKDWLLTPDATLWDNAGTKTQYDPCPPGYKVPAYNTELDMWKMLSSDVYPTLWTYDESAAYCKFTAGTVTFPLCGYINGSEQSQSGYGKRSLVWSNTVKNDTHGQGMFIRENKYYSDGNHKASGASVRCIKTDDTPDVPIVPPDKPAVDLSKKGSANSYIVTAAGDYKFKAVKGNSAESVGAVAKAEILWETENTETAPEANAIIAKVGVDEGFTTFSTPATLKPGNALIAAKDASDVILWSWHIWIPATKIQESTFGGLWPTVIMDRNLGALVATEGGAADADALSYGMYYQWGRKDPFVAPATKVNGTMTFDADKMSVDESVQHPTAYVKTGSDSVKDWNVESATTLWTVTKTVYDPCPPGYQVPTRDKSTLLMNLLSAAPGWEFNTDHKWFKAGVDFDAANPATTGFIVFPVCGYIDQGELVKMGTRVYIWSAYSSSADLAYQVRGEGGNVYLEEQRKSRAGNVRCVAEATAE